MKRHFRVPMSAFHVSFCLMVSTVLHVLPDFFFPLHLTFCICNQTVDEAQHHCCIFFVNVTVLIFIYFVVMLYKPLISVFVLLFQHHAEILALKYANKNMSSYIFVMKSINSSSCIIASFKLSSKSIGCNTKHKVKHFLNFCSY